MDLPDNTSDRPTQTFTLDGLGIEGTAEVVFANYDYLKTMNIKLIKNWINPSADTVRGAVINNHLYKRLIEKYGSLEAINAYQRTQQTNVERKITNHKIYRCG